MQVFDYLFTFLEAAGPELKPYLLSNKVYWNLTVQTPDGMPAYPHFSLGWLLLYQRRLSAAPADPDRVEVLAGIDVLHEHWRTAWAKKAAHEFEVRLHQWTRFINETRADTPANGSRYRYEVQRRTILTLLAQDADELPAVQRSLLHSLDASLRGALHPGPFIQDASFEPAFPPGEFWYLYGTL